MHNRNYLIVGQPGAGKTQLASRLAAIAPRVVIFDPVLDYDTATGCIVSSGREAIRVLAEQWDEPLELIVRAESSLEFAAVSAMIERIQREPGAVPIAVVMEEAGIYAGGTWDIPEPVRRLYTLGRRWCVNCLAIAQVDTDLHRVFRHTTHCWIALRSQKLSSDLARYFDPAAVSILEPLTPGIVAEPGRHYLTSPTDFDVFAEWEKAVTPHN